METFTIAIIVVIICLLVAFYFYTKKDQEITPDMIKGDLKKVGEGIGEGVAKGAVAIKGELDKIKPEDVKRGLNNVKDGIVKIATSNEVRGVVSMLKDSVTDGLEVLAQGTNEFVCGDVCENCHRKIVIIDDSSDDEADVNGGYDSTFF